MASRICPYKKALAVGTTINDIVGRQGGASETEDLEDVLFHTRRLLSDISVVLKARVDRLFDSEVDEVDKRAMDDLYSLIG